MKKISLILWHLLLSIVVFAQSIHTKDIDMSKLSSGQLFLKTDRETLISYMGFPDLFFLNKTNSCINKDSIIMSHNFRTASHTLCSKKNPFSRPQLKHSCKTLFVGVHQSFNNFQ
jgi:hypothetical protein